MTHFQMLSLLRIFNLDWNYILNQMFTSLEFATNSFTQLFSLQCLLDKRSKIKINRIGSNDDENVPRLYYQRFIIFTSLPILVVLSFLLFKLIKQIIFKTYVNSLSLLGNLAVVFYLLHIEISKSLFEIFRFD